MWCPLSQRGLMPWGRDRLVPVFWNEHFSIAWRKSWKGRNWKQRDSGPEKEVEDTPKASPGEGVSHRPLAQEVEFWLWWKKGPRPSLMLPSSNIRTNEHLCTPRPLFFKGNNDVLLITQGSKLCDFSSVTVLTDHTQHRSCLCFVFPHNLVSSLQLCWREPFVTLIHLTNITEAPQLCARHLLCVYYAPSTLLSTGHSVPSRSFLLLIPFRPFPGGGT